ncbi:hypothetical protein Taro_031911, partial [Colocasia esculenta]|nr:hypothetical protein [Colocasia esculenta]
CLVSWVLLVWPCWPVLLVVSASVSSRFHSPVIWCQSVVALACVVFRPRGMFGVWDASACGPSTLWRSEVAMLVVRCPSHMVAQWSPSRVCVATVVGGRGIALFNSAA